MRAHARAEGLSTGRWNGGSVAARERDGADRWGLPVSVPREREGEGAGVRSADAGRKQWAGLRPSFKAAHCAVSFSFSFVQFLLDI